MSFFRMIWQYKIAILMSIFVVFLTGYFVTEYFYNSNCAKYVYSFKAESNEVEIILDEEFYTQTFLKIDEYNETADKKISYAKIDYKAMLRKATLENDSFLYQLSIPKKYFPSIVSTSTGKVNASENRVKNYFNLLFSYTEVEVEFDNVRLIGNQNAWFVGGMCALSLTTCFILIIGVYVFKNRGKELFIEDNQMIFTSIFHKAYWKDSLSFMRSVKKMCTISVLFGCMLICKFLPIPSGFGGLGLSFTYLFFATISLIYGPICGLSIGICSDLLGYLIHPGGMFFLGYTLDAMLSGFIYGVCFYKKRITFANCLIARTFVNLFVNVGLGGLWWKILYQLDWDAYLTYVSLTSLPKNILYLLPQSILLFIFFKAVSRPLASFGFIDVKIKENIRLF